MDARAVGHKHQYERSEPEGGLTVIVTGAAGAGGSLNEVNRHLNPDSRVLVGAHHFCVLTVESNRRSMKVVNDRDEIIDTREWSPRPAR